MFAFAEQAHFIVTGATGWIGSATLDYLAAQLGPTFSGRIHAFASCDRELVLRNGQRVSCHELAKIDDLPAGDYYVLHNAFLTRDRVSGMSLQDYIAANNAITDLVAKAALRLKARGVFVPSSGAVYTREHKIDEDLENNPYGVMKYHDELRFTEVADTIGCPAVITRVFNLAGPYINKTGSYALACIISDALNNRPVTLRADHRVVRSYIHIDDLVRLILTCLQKGGAGQRYHFDTAGEVAVEVGELAQLVLETLQPDCQEIRRPALGDSADDYYVGDSAAMQALLSSFGFTNRTLRQQIIDTANFLRA